MTTLYGCNIEEKDKSIIFECNRFLEIDSLKNHVLKLIHDCGFKNITNLNFLRLDGDIKKLIINDYKEVILIVIENACNEKYYYVIDNSIRYLKVSNNDKQVELSINDNKITNESLEDNMNTSRLVHFINYLNTLNSIISFNFDGVILCNNLRIFDDEHSKIIIENTDLILALPSFYKENMHKMRLNIISKQGMRTVGSLEFRLNNKGESNFSFEGNVSFNIYSDYKNMGYERKSLSLLRNYVSNSMEDINKELYIAADDHDFDEITSIAVSNGGLLVYSGSVSKKEPVHFRCKVDKVYVYRIGN